MQHVDRVKATNAWDSSPRLLDLLKRKIIRVNEAFTVRLILIYLELCCTLDFKFACCSQCESRFFELYAALFLWDFELL